jgi:Apea-like HEPN
MRARLRPRHSRTKVLKVAHDDRHRYRLVVPLNGLSLDPHGEAFAAEGVSIRSVSDTERGEWLDERGGMSQAFLQAGDIAFPEVVVEFEMSSERDAAFDLNPGPVPSLIGALQLHGYLVAGRFYLVQSDPPWLFPIRQQVPFTVPGIVDGRSVLTAEDFAAAVTTAKVLAGYGITQPRSPKDLALHRFFAGVARQSVTDFHLGGADRNAADAVLDFTIALEALLLPYDEKARHGDLGYRFRMHGAHFLADERAQRAGLARKLGGIYEVRSRLVHGGKYPSLDEIQTTRGDARELARRGLLRAVHDGFPTAGAFNQMVLGTE